MEPWRVYFPDDGDGRDDAQVIVGRRDFWCAEDAARAACEMDYTERDGWERGDATFPAVVISPDGQETKWNFCHEPSVEHTVREADE